VTRNPTRRRVSMNPAAACQPFEGLLGRKTAYPLPAEVAGATYRTVGPGSALNPEGTPGNITLFGGLGVAVGTLAVAYRPYKVLTTLGTLVIDISHFTPLLKLAPRRRRKSPGCLNRTCSGIVPALSEKRKGYF